MTGGARMGEAVAAVLADGGADVAFTYRMSADAAEQAAAAVKARGRRALTLHANLGDPLECRTAVNEAAAAFGRLDILVNMASLYAHVPFDEEDEDHWTGSSRWTFAPTFLCCRAAVPHMRPAGGGRIVNFSDWIAASGRPRYTGYVAYYVAKAGVKALTEALALELAADQILRERGRAGADRGAAGHDRRGARRGRAGDAARPLGRRRRDRQAGGVPA